MNLPPGNALPTTIIGTEEQGRQVFRASSLLGAAAMLVNCCSRIRQGPTSASRPLIRPNNGIVLVLGRKFMREFTGDFRSAIGFGWGSVPMVFKRSACVARSTDVSVHATGRLSVAMSASL